MAKDIAVELYNLLMQKGTYAKVSEVDANIFEQFTSSNGFSTLDLHCPKCNENKTFVYVDWDYIKGLGGYVKGSNYYQNTRSIFYKCPTCGQCVLFIFHFDGNSIIKLAQYPSLYDVSRDELKKYQKNKLIDKDSFREIYKAETCASSGYYVAAYTYMRRVYETMLMSVFTDNQGAIGLSEDEFRKLHSDKKLEAIKDYLAIDDEIYLPLYGLLSAGIHAMTEEQCCEDYVVLKPILLEILAEQKAKQEQADKRKELKELFAKRKGEMK